MFSVQLVWCEKWWKDVAGTEEEPITFEAQILASVLLLSCCTWFVLSQQSPMPYISISDRWP